MPSQYDICVQRFLNFSYEPDEIYCNATWDEALCWPPTKAGENATQRCPEHPTYNSSLFTFRTCTYEGRWEGKFVNDTSMANGFTHFPVCLTDWYKYVYDLMNKEGGDYVTKYEIAKNTRSIEFIGLTVSLISLLMSLFIFFYFRGLKNNRTRIHTHLFSAMTVQVTVRLILYTDQTILTSLPATGITNTRYLCETGIVLLEFARTAMFMWMFIEGLYLHNMLTVTVFQANSYYVIYYIIGWGIPFLITLIWTIVMLITNKTRCWPAYSFTRNYWILEGPRCSVIILNIMFLVNIIRILLVKLRESHTSEIEQVRTAVRATVFLLPLLGIVNIIILTNPHLDGKNWQFALWSYSTHFLISFQGFFIALLYCFLNGEVRSAIKGSALMSDVLGKYQKCSHIRRKSLSNTQTSTA